MDKQESPERPPLGENFDQKLDALGDIYRRRLLIALLDHNPQDDEDAQLPTNVAIADADMQTLQMRMHHVHLPKLDEMGYIDWDPEADTVAKGPNFEEIRPLLTLMREHEDELPDGWL